MTIAFRTRRRAATEPRGSGSVLDPWRHVDWILMSATIVLAVIGAFNVFATTQQRLINQGFNPYFYVTRQVTFLIMAAVVLTLVMAVGHDWLRSKSVFLYIGTVLSLALLFIAGRVTGGARLSFDLGIIAVQPAEIAKSILILFLASYLADAATIKIEWEEFVIVLLLAGLPMVLVLLQPDLGSASVLAAGTAGILLVAGVRRRHVIAIAAMSLATLGATIVSGVVRSYQLNRLTAFVRQNDVVSADLQNVVLQVRFAKRAIASGGLFGKGYLQGPLTNGAYIPVQFTDFPFTAIGEQFGLVGCLIVVGLFSVVLWRMWAIARFAQSRLGRFIAAGICTTMLWQVFQNIGMALGLTPVSGLPLPLVSYGGSHLIGWAIMLGLVQSVHMRRTS